MDLPEGLGEPDIPKESITREKTTYHTAKTVPHPVQEVQEGE